MKYNEFKEQLESIDKQKKEICQSLCINTWASILRDLNIPFKYIFKQSYLSLDNEILIGLSLTDNEKWCISYYNYMIEDTMFPYGELFSECIVEEQLFNMIKIAKMLVGADTK